MARYIGSSGSSFDRQRQSKEAQSILRGSNAPLRLCRPLILGDMVYKTEFFVGIENGLALSSGITS